MEPDPKILQPEVRWNGGCPFQCGHLVVDGDLQHLFEHLVRVHGWLRLLRFIYDAIVNVIFHDRVPPPPLGRDGGIICEADGPIGLDIGRQGGEMPVQAEMPMRLQPQDGQQGGEMPVQSEMLKVRQLQPQNGRQGGEMPRTMMQLLPLLQRQIGDADFGSQMPQDQGRHRPQRRRVNRPLLQNFH